jgi:hypothetical protein
MKGRGAYLRSEEGNGKEIEINVSVLGKESVRKLEKFIPDCLYFFLSFL